MPLRKTPPPNDFRIRTDEKFKKTIIEHLILRRDYLQISQNQCDHIAGYTEGYLSKLEMGKRKFSLDSLCYYGEALGLELYWRPIRDKNCQTSNSNCDNDNNSPEDKVL